MIKSFPLVRRSISNEHVMTAVFLVTLLYLLPAWSQAPLKILEFIAILATALLIDAVANFIRYSRPVCAVSSGVTAVILEVLTLGIPFWGRILGVGFALLIKHIWGGTGKNIFNPAITALFGLSLFFKINDAVITFSFWLIPVMLLSLVFLRFRFFAGVGLMSGMVLSLLIHHHWSFQAFVAYGVIFWGCLVITDPVTTTPQPVAGLLGGFLVGFLPFDIPNFTATRAALFLIFNLLSFAIDQKWFGLDNTLFFKPLKITSVIPLDSSRDNLLDLTGLQHIRPVKDLELSTEEILDRIQTNQVYGCGGAAFPTIQKIETVINADVPQKYFIVNGTECDPGLNHDKWLLRRFPEELSLGIKAISRCIAFAEVFLAVKHAEGLNFPEGIKIFQVPEFYPAGAEKILIAKILQTRLTDNAIPAKLGVLVLNVQTVYQIYEACYLNRKAVTKYLTLANLKKKESRVVRVKLGESIHHIVNQIYPASNLIFSGGGLMQSHLTEDTDKVETTTNFIAVAHYPRYKESPLCSRCGLCRMYCPARLEVAKIADLVDSGEITQVAKYCPEKCISCGSCSYVCLAGRNLSAKVRESKDIIDKVQR